MASRQSLDYQIPTNFPDLLNEFTLEILRNQPQDIYEFGLRYFRALENVSCSPWLTYKGARFQHL